MEMLVLCWMEVLRLEGLVLALHLRGLALQKMVLACLMRGASAVRCDCRSEVHGVAAVAWCSVLVRSR